MYPQNNGSLNTKTKSTETVVESKVADKQKKTRSLAVEFLLRVLLQQQRLSYTRALLVAALFAALGAIGTFLFSRYYRPGFSGSETYTKIAREIFETGTFSTTYRPPLYPICIAGAMSLINHTQSLFPELSLDAVLLALNLTLGLASALLLFLITYQLTAKKAPALIAVCLYLGYIQYQLEITTKRETALFVFLELLLAFWWLRLKDWRFRGLCLGVVLGLLHLTRPVGVLFFLAVAISEAVQFPELSWKRRLATISVITLFFFATITPWMMTTYRITGKITIASSHNFGQGLYKGHNAFFDQIFPWVDVDLLEPHMRAMLSSGTLLDYHSDDFFQQEAISYIKSNPAQLLTSTILKGVAFISPFPTPLGKSDVIEVGQKIKIKNYRFRNLQLGLLTAVYVILLWGLSWYAFSRGNERIRNYSAFILLITFFMLAIQCLTFSEFRYRLPVDVLAIALGACGPTLLLRKLMVRESSAARSSGVERL